MEISDLKKKNCENIFIPYTDFGLTKNWLATLKIYTFSYFILNSKITSKIELLSKSFEYISGGVCYCAFPNSGAEVLGTKLQRGQKPVSCELTSKFH